ncbi:MinD/ParA family protein [Senegalia massiliensis]|jgi:flagellar biosynthesis protein FlhG|uniref:MinD/ParA family protein n=1 Tax=Senegalia massiliensis TaxID=1720316 RepID=UPI0010327A7E|nr:MinD/ParA family protein [Senegalia massiliensis]
MNDQAEMLRKLIINRNKEKDLTTKILTITSGKGGVGKTNFTINLALSLCKLGKKVVILDADIGFANVDILLGLVPQYTLLDLLYKDKEIMDLLVEGPYGLKVIAGGTGLNDIMYLSDKETNKLINKFLKLEEIADFIIIDTSAGISEMSLNFIRSSDEIILITTPEPTSITDGYSMLKVINNYVDIDKIHIVINRVIKHEEYIQSFNKLSNVSRKFLNLELNNLGFLYESKLLVESVRNQQPFVISYPKSDISKKINIIASNLINYDAYNQSDGMKKFINKIKNFFNRGGY